MKSGRTQVELIALYEELGIYRAVGALLGCDHKTVKRYVEAAGEAGQLAPALCRPRSVRLLIEVWRPSVALDHAGEHVPAVDRGAQLPQSPDHPGAAEIQRAQGGIFSRVVVRMTRPEPVSARLLGVSNNLSQRSSGTRLIPSALRELFVLVRAPQHRAPIIAQHLEPHRPGVHSYLPIMTGPL
jgi:hypothetical protein